MEGANTEGANTEGANTEGATTDGSVACAEDGAPAARGAVTARRSASGAEHEATTSRIAREL